MVVVVVGGIVVVVVVVGAHSPPLSQVIALPKIVTAPVPLVAIEPTWAHI